MSKKTAVPAMYRQGDVLITRIDSIPGNAKERPRDNGKVILAYGEVTGHAHAIADFVDAPRAMLLDVPGTEGIDITFLRVDEVSELIHDEHGAITLEPGNYRVTRQREYAPDFSRFVAD